MDELWNKTKTWTDCANARNYPLYLLKKLTKYNMKK